MQPEVPRMTLIYSPDAIATGSFFPRGRAAFPASDAESALEMVPVDVREHSRGRSPALQRIDPLVQEADIAGNAIDGAAPPPVHSTAGRARSASLIG